MTCSGDFSSRAMPRSPKPDWRRRYSASSCCSRPRGRRVEGWLRLWLPRRLSGRVRAMELAAEAAVDDAVRRFRAAVRASIDQFKNVQPSRGQVRRSEEQIGLTSSALRALVWQPLEEQLSGIKRAYIAPDG